MKCEITYGISGCRELGKCSAVTVLALKAQGPELTPGMHIKMAVVLTCTYNTSWGRGDGRDPISKAGDIVLPSGLSSSLYVHALPTPCVKERKQIASNY